MKIKLNTKLKAIEETKKIDISYNILALSQSQHSRENRFSYKLLTGKVETSLPNQGFVGLVSYCYSNHLPLAIAPHDLWVVILSEISKEIATNTSSYRQLFTKSETKEMITVPSDSMTEIPINVLSDAVSKNILFDSSILFQNFSTQTPIISETIQAIFCDMASPYYDYSMFMCGIPSIQLLGTVQDWEKVSQGFKDLVHLFNQPSLHSYFKKAQPILEHFISASKGDISIDFWKDIFTQKNVGSGGQLTIDGWITKLFMTEHSLPKITNFTKNKGVVKYTQLQTKDEFVAVYGGFDTKLNSDGFYELEYAKYIMQKVCI